MTDHDKSAEHELQDRLYGHRPCSECNGYENTECERCGSRGVVDVAIDAAMSKEGSANG